MISKFINGNTYVFTKKKFIQNSGRKQYRTAKGWINKCNGRLVKIEDAYQGEIGCFGISPIWCKCVNQLKLK